MKKTLVFLSFLCWGVLGTTWAQDNQSTIYRQVGDRILLPTTLLPNGDRIAWVLLPDVEITVPRTFKSEADRKAYMRLRYNVLKVLPYARIAENKYKQLHRDLAQTNNRREQKRLVKATEKEIKALFEKEIKNMTVTQGEILLKLIDRQTGNSSYEVVKELRGGVSAFFYQSLAKLFGHDLKNDYSRTEDREIENIIRNVERSRRFYPY